MPAITSAKARGLTFVLLVTLAVVTAVMGQDPDPASFNCPTKPSTGALPVCVTTYHNQNTRKGINSTETILTKAKVTAGLTSFTDSVSGEVYAQPLFLPAVQLSGQSAAHNVVYVATETNDVYAFDGDASQTTAYWHLNLTTPPGQGTRYGVTAGQSGPPVNDIGCQNIEPNVGITGTPAIQITSSTSTQINLSGAVM